MKERADFVFNNRKIRGWIVRILCRAYPAGFEADTLWKQLHELGYEITRKDFDANLNYLLEDDFIELRKFGNIGYDDLLNNKIYKLTTKGIDLAEKTIVDIGVDV